MNSMYESPIMIISYFVLHGVLDRWFKGPEKLSIVVVPAALKWLLIFVRYEKQKDYISRYEVDFDNLGWYW